MVTHWLRDCWYDAQKKGNKYARKWASSLEWCDSLERFQTAIYIKGCMGRIHSIHDVRALHTMVIFWCGEPAQASLCSRFRYQHISGFVLFVSLAKHMVRFFFYDIHFFHLLVFINIFNWWHFFILHATVLKCELSPMELFIKTLVRSDDR